MNHATDSTLKRQGYVRERKLRGFSMNHVANATTPLSNGSTFNKADKPGTKLFSRLKFVAGLRRYLYVASPATPACRSLCSKVRRKLYYLYAQKIKSTHSYTAPFHLNLLCPARSLSCDRLARHCCTVCKGKWWHGY